MANNILVKDNKQTWRTLNNVKETTNKLVIDISMTDRLLFLFPNSSAKIFPDLLIPFLLPTAYYKEKVINKENSKLPCNELISLYKRFFSFAFYWDVTITLVMK